MRHFLARLATLALLSLTTPAAASVIDYSGAVSDFGTVAAGQSGTVTNGLGLTGQSSQSGYLAADTAITFTYTYANLTLPSLSDNGAYSYASGGTAYTGSASDTAGLLATSTGTANGATSAALVLATANFNGATGTTTIINNSGSAASFQSLFSGLRGLNPSLTISYAVSAVPLPAALPMFAVVLAGMVGFGVLRRQTIKLS